MPNTIPEKAPARWIDHTLLAASTTAADIDRLCEEAVEYAFAAVCVPPAYIAQAQRNLYGSDVLLATVCGFPLGNSTTEVKCYEAKQSVAQGAQEVDMVLPVGSLLANDFTRVADDVAAVVQAVPEATIKVILECCLLTPALIEKAVNLAAAAGADYVKTSTGFAGGGAQAEDVKRMVAQAQGRLRVKASGGIRTLEHMQTMIAAGADRIGTSSGVAIQQQWLQQQGL